MKLKTEIKAEDKGKQGEREVKKKASDSVRKVQKEADGL